jgi:hypothetical protein
MVKHGALSKSHVYQLLRSKDVRVRRAAFILLETSNPRLRRSSELFIEITRFIWDANPSYYVYQEFTKRHFQVRHKVHELISARLKIEEQKKQSAAADHLTDNTLRTQERRHLYHRVSDGRRRVVGDQRAGWRDPRAQAFSGAHALWAGRAGCERHLIKEAGRPC